MLEVQRVACAEDWLSRVRDDLAAGHRREAFMHLATAQAELKLLTEQLAGEIGFAAKPVLTPVRTGVPLPIWGAAVATLLLAIVMTLQSAGNRPVTPVPTGTAPVELSQSRPAFEPATHLARIREAAQRASVAPVPDAEPVQLAQAPSPAPTRRHRRAAPVFTALPVALTPAPAPTEVAAEPLPEPAIEKPVIDLVLATLMATRSGFAGR